VLYFCHDTAIRDAPDFVEVGEAGVAVSDALRHQLSPQFGALWVSGDGAGLAVYSTALSANAGSYTLEHYSPVIRKRKEIRCD
jgi:hypothetical protein